MDIKTAPDWTQVDEGWGRRAVDVAALRDAGFDDAAIFAMTAYVARIAFSTVNDALGARPDALLGESVPDAVHAAVGYGRPIASLDEVITTSR
jgi:hypothetical protein